MCDQSMPMGAEVDEPYHGSFEFAGANPTARRATHPGCELRASKMYMYCDCNRRNGLQDNCPRTVCSGNSNQMQGAFSQNDGMQMRGFAMPNNGLYSKNAGSMPFGTPMSGYQEYFGDGIPAGLAIHPYSSAQQSGSNWGGSQQGNQACELRSDGRHMGHMGYGDMAPQRW